MMPTHSLSGQVEDCQQKLNGNMQRAADWGMSCFRGAVKNLTTTTFRHATSGRDSSRQVTPAKTVTPRPLQPNHLSPTATVYTTWQAMSGSGHRGALKLKVAQKNRDSTPSTIKAANCSKAVRFCATRVTAFATESPPVPATHPTPQLRTRASDWFSTEAHPGGVQPDSIVPL